MSTSKIDVCSIMNKDMRREEFQSTFLKMEGDAMRKSEIKKIVRILVGTKLYKTLPAKERYDFIKYIVRKSSFSS